MFRFIGVAVVLFLTSGVSLGQDVAAPSVSPLGDGVIADPATVSAIDPSAPTPTDAGVVDQCTTMAADLSVADPTQGPCITAAQTYIAAIAAAPGGLPPSTDGVTPRDAALNAMVGKVAQLTQDDICDVRDEELAAAVDAAAAAAESEDTRATLTEVARTIREDCTTGTTAALVDGSPADANVL